MRRDLLAAIGVGAVVFCIWYFVLFAVVWPRTGIATALGVSVAVNVALVWWVARGQSAPSNE